MEVINEKIFLDVILVEDKKDGGYTAFFKEFPFIVVEGNTIDEAKTSLKNTLHDIIMHKKNENE